MDFYELLKEDHRNIEKLLQATEKARPHSEKHEELFLELIREVRLHNYLEELLVYPMLQEKAQTLDLSLESIEEHRIMQMLLDEMEDVTTRDEQWAAKFQVFKEQIARHVREEEEKTFPAARKIFTNEQAEELGARIMTEKALQRAANPEPITE